MAYRTIQWWIDQGAEWSEQELEPTRWHTGIDLETKYPTPFNVLDALPFYFMIWETLSSQDRHPYYSLQGSTYTVLHSQNESNKSPPTLTRYLQNLPKMVPDSPMAQTRWHHS